MKRSIFIPIAILLCAGMTSPVVAQTRTTMIEPVVAKTQTTSRQITPFNLAYLAYQGYFKTQGIPAAGGLIDSIVSKKITAQDLIRVAIKTDGLSVQTLSDRGYISNLESQLEELTDD